MASLKDLAPAEKAKVAKLLSQVVEREQSAVQLQAELEAERRRSRAQLEQLREQNKEVALENTSLRAKLAHAFELLRTYQHRMHILEATLQATGPSSRPTTPAAAPTSPQHWLPPISCTVSAKPPAGESSTGQPTQPAGLSPIVEGLADGVVPGSVHGGASKDQGCEAALDVGSYRGRDSLQPQLTALNLLAQALVEAQAEVLGRRQAGHMLKRTQQQGLPQQPTTTQALTLQCDPAEGPQQGFVIPPSAGLGPESSSSITSKGAAEGIATGDTATTLEGPAPADLTGAADTCSKRQQAQQAQAQFIVGSSTSSNTSQAAELAARAQACDAACCSDAAAQACPASRAVFGQWQPRSTTPGPALMQFEPSLTELVEEVEQMQQQEHASWCRQTQQPQPVPGGSRWQGLFELSDLISLISDHDGAL